MFQSTSTNSPFRAPQQQQNPQTPNQFQPSHSFTQQPPQNSTNSPFQQSQFGYGNQYQQQQQHHHPGQQQYGMGGMGMGGSAGPSGSQGFGMMSMSNNGTMGEQQGGAGGTPQTMRKTYMPGYLLGNLANYGAPNSSSDQNQSQSSDDRSLNASWDSPAGNTSGGAPSSPQARFNQSLFGPTSGTSPSTSGSRESTTPSKSPRRASIRGGRGMDIEEDAPPTESLSYFSSSPPTSSSFASSTSPPTPSFQPLTTRSSTTAATPPATTTTPTATKTYAVTVYGFPASALPHLLTHFSSFGPIVSSVSSPTGGNWITINYANPWEALRASRQDGTVLGEILMIGVKMVDEESVRAAIAGGENVAGESSTERVSTPIPASSGGLGKKVTVLGPGQAFKPVVGSPKKGIWGGGGGAIGAVKDSPGGVSLFAEKKNAATANAGADKGVLGKLGDYVFGF